MLNFQLSQSAAELLIFCPQPSHLANQIANNANQVRVREPFQRIRDARCHPKLESYFRGLDSPARKSAPVTQLVPRRGLEPPRLAPLVPETSASTNSATWAWRRDIKVPVSPCQHGVVQLRHRFALAGPREGEASGLYSAGAIRYAARGIRVQSVLGALPRRSAWGRWATLRPAVCAASPRRK